MTGGDINIRACERPNNLVNNEVLLYFFIETTLFSISGWWDEIKDYRHPDVSLKTQSILSTGSGTFYICPIR